MKSMNTIIFLLFLSFPRFVYACVNINFYEKHPLINQLGISNQGNLNTCYAQTLSTVYNLEFAKDADDVVDPFWIAFIHKVHGLHWTPRNLEYSLLSMAWADLKKNGYCDISHIRPTFQVLKKTVPYSDNQLFFLLNEFFKVKIRANVKTNSGFYTTILHLMKKLPQGSANLFEVPWKREDLITVLNPIRLDAYGKDLFSWLGKKVLKDCLDSAFFKPNEALISIGRNKELNDPLAIVIETLMEQKRAVAIGMCGRIFKEPSRNFLATPRILKAVSSNCGAHYVTLVGSRKTAKSCEYLVRNSYGKKFWGHPEYLCYCHDKALGKNRDCGEAESLNPHLEVLGCWIDKEKLLTNTYDLSYFKK